MVHIPFKKRRYIAVTATLSVTAAMVAVAAVVAMAVAAAVATAAAAIEKKKFPKTRKKL